MLLRCTPQSLLTVQLRRMKFLKNNALDNLTVMGKDSDDTICSNAKEKPG